MLTTLHLTFVFAAAAVVLYSDEQGLLWIRGKREMLAAKRLEILHALVGLALAGLIATGGILFSRAPSYYLANPLFLSKMVFVLGLIINGFFIARFTRVAATRSWASLSSRERLPLLVSGAVSGACWVAAASLGLLLAG